MPRDPKDISVAGPQRTQRRLGELEDQKDPLRIRVGAGPAGPEGAEGKAGTNGAKWYSGTEIPSAGLGANGDFYFLTTTEDVYEKSGGAWGIITNVKGEKGATGATGAGGKEGPAGSAENNDWKNSVRVATTANITISTALNPGDSLDGITLVENDRVLVKNQTTAKENGIYVVLASPARALDADAAGELTTGSTVYVEEGTQNGAQFFTLTTTGGITIGTTAIAFASAGAWAAAGLTANWKNYESATFAKAEYRKTSDGLVQLRGLVQPAATGQNTVFTLPAGFRPKLEQGFASASSIGATPTTIRVDVLANGEVKPEASFGGTTTAYFLFLDSISFFTD